MLDKLSLVIIIIINYYLPLELLVNRRDKVLRDITDISAPGKSRTIVIRPNPPGITRTLAMRRGSNPG